jgi:hypothetical protein
LKASTNLATARGQVKWIMDKEKTLNKRQEVDIVECLKHTHDLIDNKMRPMIEDIASHCNFSMHKELKDAKKKRIIKLLREQLKKLALLNITIEELMDEQPFPSSPLERPDSDKFIELAKKGDNFAMRRMLRSCKYFVYQFDHVFTCLTVVETDCSSLGSQARFHRLRSNSDRIQVRRQLERHDESNTDILRDSQQPLHADSRTPSFILDARRGRRACVGSRPSRHDARRRERSTAADRQTRGGNQKDQDHVDIRQPQQQR